MRYEKTGPEILGAFLYGSRANLKGVPLPGRADERAADTAPGRLAAVAGNHIERMKIARLFMAGRNCYRAFSAVTAEGLPLFCPFSVKRCL